MVMVCARLYSVAGYQLLIGRDRAEFIPKVWRITLSSSNVMHMALKKLKHLSRGSVFMGVSEDLHIAL